MVGADCKTNFSVQRIKHWGSKHFFDGGVRMAVMMMDFLVFSFVTDGVSFVTPPVTGESGALGCRGNKNFLRHTTPSPRG